MPRGGRYTLGEQEAAQVQLGTARSTPFCVREGRTVRLARQRRPLVGNRGAACALVLESRLLLRSACVRRLVFASERAAIEFYLEQGAAKRHTTRNDREHIRRHG